MQHKTFEVEAKADGEPGGFTALASVFGNVDRVGDRVVPGAFTKSLRRWRESGDPIPIVFSHRWDDPHAHIGVADPKNVKQTKDGLVVKGKLDIEDNDLARQVYKLMKRRSLKSWSFGYSVQDEELDDDGVTDLKEIDLHEAGPTLVGANPDAELQAVKSALEEQKSQVEDEEEEPPPANSTQDPLRRETERVRLEVALGNPPGGIESD